MTKDIGDTKLIKEKHPEVLWIGDLKEKYKIPYNELQFKILSNSDKHLSSSGDAVIPAYFGGDLVIYNCPNCNSKDRGVWGSGSWLGELSGCEIFGFNKYDEIINKTKLLWL